MRRGDIWLCDFEPARGQEANKIRPAVIVSNDGANISALRTGLGVVTVVPLTTATAVVLPFQTLISNEGTGLKHESKAQPEQIRALAVARVHQRIGALGPSAMAALDGVMKVHLGL